MKWDVGCRFFTSHFSPRTSDTKNTPYLYILYVVFSIRKIHKYSVYIYSFLFIKLSCVCVTSPTITCFVICISPSFFFFRVAEDSDPYTFDTKLFSGVCNTPLHALFYMLFILMSTFYIFILLKLIFSEVFR